MQQQQQPQQVQQPQVVVVRDRAERRSTPPRFGGRKTRGYNAYEDDYRFQQRDERGSFEEEQWEGEGRHMDDGYEIRYPHQTEHYAAGVDEEEHLSISQRAEMMY